MAELESRNGHPRTIGLAALAVVLLATAWLAADVLLLLFGCVLFSLLLGGGANWLAARSGLNRGIAFSIVVVGMLLLVAGIGWFLAGRVISQFQDLTETLPKAATHLADQLRGTDWGRKLLDSVTKWQAGAGRGDVFGRITGVFSSGLGVIANILILLFGTLYFAGDPDLYRRGFVRLFPPGMRGRIGDTLAESGQVLRAWLLGKLMLMAFVAVITGTGLALLGVPLALTLGVLAGLFDFVPNFGPLIAFIPAGLIALTIDPMLVVWTGLLYYAVQLTENYVLTPIVQRHASNLAPAVIIFSQVALGVIFGVLGLLFAEPLAAAAQVVIRKLYIEVQES